MNPTRTVMFVVLLLWLALPSSAAEFSPAIQAQLDLAAPDEFVSAILILESPIDIRALDDRLHAEKAPLAVRHSEIIDALKYNVAQTQPAFRAELDAAKAKGLVRGYTAYWIENLFVVYAQKQFLESLRERMDIRYASENFEAVLIDPIRSNGKAHTRRSNSLDSETTTPGQDATHATQVNRELGITGQGVLVANLDTGVDGTHPALASRWRGNFAPTSECWLDVLGGIPTPADYNNHGTHVMGTITGRAISGTDTNTVGAAPNARWIACNAIDQGVASEFDNDVIAAFQWFTDPDGNAGTLDDVPDVIQNSWGVNGNFTGYSDCFDYWNTVVLNCEAAGPVITWSAGNEGPSASTQRAPATFSFNEYQIFSVGAVDATNYSAPYPIASFSSRGPTLCTPATPDDIKPDISAPGVDVYSSIPGGGYDGTYDGTSMAGPHVAGVVALMREACPDCDYQTIKEALISTAVDYGTAGNDNTYGHGFIDAYAAVLAVSNLGRLGGVVDDGSNPLEGVKVEITSAAKSILTDASGQYYLPLSAGTYDVEYSKFGYLPQTFTNLSITEGDTTYQNVTMVLAPQGMLSGTVTSCYGGPAVGASVELVGAPVSSQVTNGSGYYSFTIPQGIYDVRASGAGCGEQVASDVVVSSNTTQDFTLPSDPRFECSAPDGGGYIACENGDAGGPAYSWFEISPAAAGPGTNTGITGDDAGATVALPFTFRFYGQNYTSVWICSNGFVSFDRTRTTYENQSLPTDSINVGIAAMWDDLNPLSSEHVSTYYYAVENAFLIEWYQIPYWRDNASDATFQLWLYDVSTTPGPTGDSQIRVQYQNIDLFGSITVGTSDGTNANQYVFDGGLDVNAQGLENLRVITFNGADIEYGTIQGTVTDASTLLGLENVSVSRVGSAQSVLTASGGVYAMNVPVGTFDFEFSKAGYSTASVTGLVFADGTVHTEDVALSPLPVVTLLNEDFESGAPGWTHDAASGWGDQWHLSTERANSGVTSYKCGDTGTGDYANLLDARLTSPVLTGIPASAFLTFSMQIEAEVSATYAEYAYDGGVVEVSSNGTIWDEVVPVPGYERTFRPTSSGPMPGRDCYAEDVLTWTEYSVDLSAYEGSDLQIRFRFGSDGGVGNEGWYVDDVVLQGYGDTYPSPSDLTIYYNESTVNLDFNWSATGASIYSLFSAVSSDGPFSTLEGSTAGTTISIALPGDTQQYYVVVSGTNPPAIEGPNALRPVSFSR